MRGSLTFDDYKKLIRNNEIVSKNIHETKMGR